MGKKLVTEELNRIKSLMGILTEEIENSNCYPSDYEPGKHYEREELSNMFSCFAGEKDFPVDGVMEWMFPLKPDEKKGHVSPSYDPKNMDMGYEKPITMEELVNIWKKKVSHLNLETISISPEEIHPETLSFIPEKKSSSMGKKRINFQMKKAMKCGVESLTQNEPFVIEKKDGKYKWDEGWNRLIALIELYNKGKIEHIEGKCWIVNKIE
jgi:hypothetical protein